MARPVFAPEEPSDGIARSSLALSAAFHLVLGAILIVGLPKLFSPPEPQEFPVAVQLVTIAPETRATHPNPEPKPEAKPEVPDIMPPVAKPEPKPEPPRLAPVPPPTTAAPPHPEPQHLPETKPEPPKPAEKVEMPKPPLPKPPEPKPEQVKAVEKPVEAPKPVQKPEPPRQMAKQEPKAVEQKREVKPEEKKYDPRQFEALLKNLAPNETAPSPDAPPQKAPTASAKASSQPRAPLGSQLTASELDMVRHQIARCWNVPAGARDAKDLVVEIKVVVDQDGTVRQATIVDQARLGRDPFFRAAAESARRAFFNPLCRPLHLPAEKYAIWKDLVVDFSPKDIL
jgi:outer membrane biosynthesis protein TonB